MDIDRNLIQGFFAGLKPEPRYLLSEWADAHRYLSSESAAEPGRWRTSRTPYLKEIMDNLSLSSPYQEIIVEKGVQLGFSESAYNLVGYCIDVAPCPILYVLPTIEMCRTNSKTRLDAMLKATPRLNKKVSAAKSRDGNNTILEKLFPGGMFKFGGANSASSLRNMPIRVLILDEPDGYPLDVDGEGSPVDLAVKRTSSFGARKKIYKLSTPTVEHTSVIHAEYEASTQRKYFVPCPHCGGMQILLFDRLKWEKDKEYEAQYQCEHCNELIPERFKTKMLQRGQWQDTAPEKANGVKISYWINALYSPLGWYSWGQIAQDWTDAQKDVFKLKTFVNTVLAEVWKEKGDAPEWKLLYERARNGEYKEGEVPAGVAFLTAGADVQKDRIEIEVVGWCKQKRSYSIDYAVFLGDTSGPAVWNALTEYLGRQFPRADGVLLPIILTAIDTGYNTNEVYDFCNRHDISKIIPIKGQDKQNILVAPPRAVQVSRAGKKIGTVKVWHVGVSLIKSEFYGWLRQSREGEGDYPPGYCHFPARDEHYFKGLTAEKLQFTIVKGFRKYEWVKTYERNEPLDCRVYARAAASVYGMDRFKDENFDNIAKSYFNAPAQAPKKSKKSTFWNR